MRPVCRDKNSQEYITAMKLYPDFSARTFTQEKIMHIESNLDNIAICTCCDNEIFRVICIKIGVPESVMNCAGCHCCH